MKRRPLFAPPSAVAAAMDCAPDTSVAVFKRSLELIEHLSVRRRAASATRFSDARAGEASGNVSRLDSGVWRSPSANSVSFAPAPVATRPLERSTMSETERIVAPSLAFLATAQRNLETVTKEKHELEKLCVNLQSRIQELEGSTALHQAPEVQEVPLVANSSLSEALERCSRLLDTLYPDCDRQSLLEGDGEDPAVVINFLCDRMAELRASQQVLRDHNTLSQQLDALSEAWDIREAELLAALASRNTTIQLYEQRLGLAQEALSASISVPERVEWFASSSHPALPEAQSNARADLLNVLEAECAAMAEAIEHTFSSRPADTCSDSVELPILREGVVPTIPAVDDWRFDVARYAEAVDCDATAADNVIRALCQLLPELIPLTSPLRHIALLASPLPYHGALLAAQGLQTMSALFQGTPTVAKAFDRVERTACFVAAAGCHVSLAEALAEPVALKFPGDSPLQRFHAWRLLQHLTVHDAISVDRDWSEEDQVRFRGLCATLILRTDPAGWATWVPQVQRRAKTLNLTMRADRVDVASVLVLASQLSIWHRSNVAGWHRRHVEEGLGAPADAAKACGLVALSIVGEFATEEFRSHLPQAACAVMAAGPAGRDGVEDAEVHLAAAVAENANLLELSLSYQNRVKELLVENAALAEIVSNLS